MKVQSFEQLMAEMKAVARGDRGAPADAAAASVESSEALVRLLTPENRALLGMIETKHPQSIAELQTISGRKGPNLTRTLAKLEAAGIVTMETSNRRKAPKVVTRRIVIEIDPCREADRIAYAK